MMKICSWLFLLDSPKFIFLKTLIKVVLNSNIVSEGHPKEMIQILYDLDMFWQFLQDSPKIHFPQNKNQSGPKL